MAILNTHKDACSLAQAKGLPSLIYYLTCAWSEVRAWGSIFLMDPPMSSDMTIMRTINENRAPLGLATWSYVYRLKPF